MAYLIDTNVVSELRKKGRCHPAVKAWQEQVLDVDVFISVVSLMEIKSGLMKVLRKDRKFGELLEKWYELQVKPAFEGRILPVDLPVAECCSEIMHHRTRGMADGMIAATAKVHGLTLVTRNTADFNDAGIALVNPWQ